MDKGEGRTKENVEWKENKSKKQWKGGANA